MTLSHIRSVGVSPARAVCRRDAYTTTNHFGAALPLPPLCPLNVRVGENSPSLCPIMSSVTYVFRKRRPLWTRNVTPMNSGMIVQSRDQVLIGSRLPVRRLRSTLANNLSSTYGPFFSDRLISASSAILPEAMILETRWRSSSHDSPLAA